jgi:hypothetical protein
MFEGAKVVRMIPDRPGVGGIKTGVSTQVGINDIRDCYNVYMYNGRWRNFPLPTSAGLSDDPSATAAKLLHVFSKYDLTDASATPTTHVLAYNTNGTTHRIWDHTSGVARKTVIVSGVGKTAPLTAYFLNVKNRCFMCMGAQTAAAPAQTWVNNFIFDGTNVYDVGIDAPTNAPQKASTNSYVLTGTCAATLNSQYVTEIYPGTTWSTAHYNKTIVISGTTYTIGPSPTGFREGSSIVTTGSTFTGSSTVNPYEATISTKWPTDGSYNGLTVVVGVRSYVIGSYDTPAGTSTTNVHLRTPILTTVSGVAYSFTGKQFMLTTPFGGTTAWAGTYSLQTGEMTWSGTGPKYAYAYYDEDTGHVSNGSPIFQITEENQSNMAVKLQSFTTTSDTRFDKILIFRSLLNGGEMLFPMIDGSGAFLTIANTGAPTFTDYYDDSHLLTSGALQMPQVTNKKPPAFVHMAYWDGRVWGNPVNDPSGIWFSGDSAQIQFGVPEECYPTLNVLRVAAEDGRVTGMKIFGNYLIVITDRYSYYVVGNSEANYRLVPFPAPMYGLTSNQVTQLMGQYVSEAPNISYMGNDWRMYTFNTSAGVSQISQPIQDVLDGFNSTSKLASTGRMIQAVLPQQRWLIYSYWITAGAPTFYVYDYENNVWLKVVPITSAASSSSPLAVKYTNFGQPVYYLAYCNGSTSKVYQFGGVTGSTSVSGSYIRTSPLDFGRKSQKQLAFVRIYVTGCDEAVLKATPWKISIAVDDGREIVTGDFGFEPDRLRSIQPVMATQIDSATATELVYVPTTPLQGHRFDVKVTWPTANAFPTDCLALDVAVTDIEEPNVVEP